ncbi:MAG: hypothetical protein SNJ70_08985 [Armatimonadota bacterium]
MLKYPILVYNNWSSYDELSDNLELTEDIALFQLDNLLRLKKNGINFQYYLMDAFWYLEDGGYREWRKPHWEKGPVNWLNRCKENNIIPGLWFSTNRLLKLIPIDQWIDSIATNGKDLCLIAGGYLNHLLETFQYWYDNGIRIFKLDFANFNASTIDLELAYTREEIIRKNIEYIKTGIKLFKMKNKDAIFIAYNGFGGEQSNTSYSIKKTIDESWLSVFDTLYCGDPRPSDVPCMNFWRSMNIYTDHMVKYYQFNDIPLERIDNCEFMIGKTGTCYNRGINAYKSLAILSMARGGWLNIIHGNLELIDDEKIEWIKKVQKLFIELQAVGRTYTFGGIPGYSEPYGYVSLSTNGSIYTIVNPSQSIRELELEKITPYQKNINNGFLIFSDSGFNPVLENNKIILGPEQMAVVGYGEYSNSKYYLGIDEDIIIPKIIKELYVENITKQEKDVNGTVKLSQNSSIRVVFNQKEKNGVAKRSTGGFLPKAKNFDEIFSIKAIQNNKELKLNMNYNKPIWSGLSWAVAEIEKSNIDINFPIQIRCSTKEDSKVELDMNIYSVDY